MSSVFSLDDYNSNQGMLTQTWGPPLWHVLHTISFNYPINPTPHDINNYYNFFKNLKYILPCRHCRDNLVQNYKKVNFSKKVFENRDKLSKWVYILHNHVNFMLGKECNLPYEKIRDRYENFRSRCNLSDGNQKCKKNKKPIEKGCVIPLYGTKSKCCLEFVPSSSKKKTLKVDDRCLVKRI